MGKKKKNLYWLHSHFLLNTGGTRFIYEVIAQLRATERYSVCVVVERSSSYWINKYHELGITVIEVSKYSSNSIIYWLFFPYFLVSDYVSLKRILGQTDVVISSMFPMNILSVLASPKSAKKINYCFEPFAFFYDKELLGSFTLVKRALCVGLRMLFSPLDIFGVRYQDKLLGINPSVGAYIQRIYNRKPDDYTYLGVDTNFFKPTKSPRMYPGYTLLFHSTDFTPLKGTNYLIDALKYLITTNRVKLLISESVSNPTLKEQILSQIQRLHLEEHVVFLNHVPYSDLPKIYSSCDVYCFTGNPDSMGATAASLSVLEASACGLPVVRSTGNLDEVINQITGVVVDPRDPLALSNAIQECLHKNTASKMGRNGRKHVLNTYTWPKVAKVIERSI